MKTLIPFTLERVRALASEDLASAFKIGDPERFAHAKFNWQQVCVPHQPASADLVARLRAQLDQPSITFN